jgi:hypothetical protein
LVPLVQSGGLGSARTLLNPKPPDPEAAFAFPAHHLSGRDPRKTPPKDRAASKLEAQLMSRSTQTLNRALTRAAAAAFDFDVVTDVSPRPRATPLAPDPARPDTKPNSVADPDPGKTTG